MMLTFLIAGGCALLLIAGLQTSTGRRLVRQIHEHQKHRAELPTDLGGSSGFTNPINLAGNHLSGGLSNEIVVGRAPGSTALIGAKDDGTSVLVVGATGSGKTSALVVPTMLEWDGPVLSTSVKTDVLMRTAGFRSTLGEVAVFDPSCTLPAELAHLRRHWTPLSGCNSWAGARSVAKSLISASTLHGLRGQDFWETTACMLLSIALFVEAQNREATMKDVLRLIAEMAQPTDSTNAKIQQVLDRAELIGVANTDLVRIQQELMLGFAKETFGSTVATAAASLEVYLDGTVSDIAQNDPSSIDIDRLLFETKGTLYIVGPPQSQEVYRPLYAALVKSIIDRAYDLAARSPSERLELPLLASLDEIANVAPIPNLDQIASTARSTGIRMMTCVQDLSQLRARYGEETASTIVSNHVTQVFLPMIKDQSTLKYISEIAGDQQIENVSTSRSRNTSSGKSSGQESSRSSQEGESVTETFSKEWRPLITPGGVANMKDGEVLAIIGHARTQLIQRRYFEVDELDRLARMPIPGRDRWWE
jgi:type IV secretion system protein VirD4